MTTFVPFIPSRISPPSFLATFDDSQCTVVITWNVSSQRYFINIYGTDGSWICTVPLIETAIGRTITSMTYDPDRQMITGTFDTPIWRPLGQIVNYTFEGFTPDTLNGNFDTWRSGLDQFSYNLAIDPGVISVLGFASRYVNMIEEYFQTSTLIFRNNQFEINP